MGGWWGRLGESEFAEVYGAGAVKSGMGLGVTVVRMDGTGVI